ncbi:MAG: transposase [Verrucomicrobiota bacterium]|nr:transposase [Verrucomicrobiota bacterium]
MKPDRKFPVHHSPHEPQYGKSVIIFLTVCSKEKISIFASKQAQDKLISSWEQAKGWTVGYYCLMPDHIHLFCSPYAGYPTSLKDWVKYWKSIFTRQWKMNVSIKQSIWQKDFWDTQLRSNESYSAKWQYVTQNPVRAGLVGHSHDWPYQGELNILEFS